MSKTVANRNSKTKFKKIKGGFVIFRWDVIDSPAFADLSGRAIIVFVFLKREFNGSNNGEILMSCRMISKKTRMSRATVSRAFVELQIHGFIRITRPGLYTGHTATTWELTDTYNRMTLCEAKDLWKQWKPGIDCRALDPDYCGMEPLDAIQNKVPPMQPNGNDVNPTSDELVSQSDIGVSRV